ncbi:MAG: bifunctional glutamate N-acetyltransferase/amino-acid acetyltransferase ArgJ [Oscillospiraceae bacterium]|nr:bifunctional glutamate N-acetyltransferase/amino-acid acetyltransferase ArgJ [Oscillospiraceae bacterium]
MFEQISGGVCAAKGFKAAGVHCGVKAGSSLDKNDLALILSEKECTAAGTYTLNRVKAAPVYVTMEHLEDGVAWGVVANSGNANACCPMSHENAVAMAKAAAAVTGREQSDFVVCSTGVIGQTINIAAIEAGLPKAAEKLAAGKEASDAAARAIMTTDTAKKEVALQAKIGGKMVTVGGIAKGSGMIHPNMGTMLCFITTDCAITHGMLEDALRDVVTKTFNRVTVDGDTSTNDTCVVLANGMAGNELVEWKNEDYETFRSLLMELCTELARKIAADGEGASRLITCTVSGARNEETAERLAKAVVGSSLVKAAMFGADANWGRVICAMGYSKAPFRPEYVDIRFGSAVGDILVCEKGAAVAFDEEQAKKILTQSEIVIDINVDEGDGSAECWGCDLTYDYVKINGDYRT